MIPSVLWVLHFGHHYFRRSWSIPFGPCAIGFWVVGAYFVRSNGFLGVYASIITRWEHEPRRVSFSHRYSDFRDNISWLNCYLAWHVPNDLQFQSFLNLPGVTTNYVCDSLWSETVNGAEEHKPRLDCHWHSYDSFAAKTLLIAERFRISYNCVQPNQTYRSELNLLANRFLV